VHSTHQAKPFGSWNPWVRLGGSATEVAGQASYSDGLEVFVIGRDDEVSHRWCNRVDWPWLQWTLLDDEGPLSREGGGAGSEAAR
jgi:hypothetical protein